MKISAEVRVFAANQAASSDHPGDGLGLERGAQRSAGEFAKNNPAPVRPELVEGRGQDVSEAEAEKGMAEMSELYRKQGDKLYLPQDS